MCRATDVNQLSEVVDGLVEDHILYGDDPNLTHVIGFLWDSEKEYRDQVFEIFGKEKRIKTLKNAEDLLSIGIIKRSSDRHLIIRNKIYHEALKDLFEKEDHES